MELNIENFEKLISKPRFERYLLACQNDPILAIELYRNNIQKSKEMYTLLSIFEIILRNKIDEHYQSKYLHEIGNENWLKFAASKNGFYNHLQTLKTKESIVKGINGLGNNYSHNKLIAELNFGFWRFQFAPKEFRAAGSSLHHIFINRPKGTNHTTIFNKLRLINNIRNRIAHYEPICFDSRGNKVSAFYLQLHQNQIFELLDWMEIPYINLLKTIGVNETSDFTYNL